MRRKPGAASARPLAQLAWASEQMDAALAGTLRSRPLKGGESRGRLGREGHDALVSRVAVAGAERAFELLYQLA